MDTEAPPRFDGKRLREARIDAGLTMEALARRLDVSLSNVSNWEVKGHCPNGPSLVLLASFFQRPVESFFDSSAGVC